MQYFYFDHNATTPVSPEALAAAAEVMGEVFGNASSIHHFGQAAKQRLELARRQIASRINARAREIVFVSGGTEADNLAIAGVLHASKKKHIVTTTIEHPAVLNVCACFEDVTYVKVDSSGVVNPDDVRRAIRDGTDLVTVMHANNETGALQPIAEIAAIARAGGAVMHSDGVQAAGRIAVDVQALGVDLYSLSGHKMRAPKGVGALYVREGTPLRAILAGGHHERERRAGTENVAGAAAMGVSCAEPVESFAELRDSLENGILREVEDVFVNCGRSPRLPNTTNIRFEGIKGEPLVIALDLRRFAVSSGAACSSGAVEPSHVLTAIGLRADQAASSVRFSLGAGNTAAQVDALVGAVSESVGHLRRIAPPLRERVYV